MAVFILISLLIFALFTPCEARPEGPLQRVVITYSSRSIASIDLYIARARGPHGSGMRGEIYAFQRPA